MIAASSIGENNSKCEFYNIFNLVLEWYAVSTVLRTEEIVPQVVYQAKIGVYDTKVNRER